MNDAAGPVSDQPSFSGQDMFQPVTPWPMPERDDCVFYHTLDLPDGEVIRAAWDIRGLFHDYIGGYHIAGKTVLDVGAASGFLSFEAERAGATVTSLEARSALDFTQVPHSASDYLQDRNRFLQSTDEILGRLKSSYWYGWHRIGSQAEVVYAPLAELSRWERRFDVVIAGAITEHLSDPVTAIGNLTVLAREAVIIAFDPVVDSDEETLTAGPNWAALKPRADHTWYFLSRGLYRRVFDNLGFDVEFVDSHAIALFAGETEPTRRTTVIARRRPG